MNVKFTFNRNNISQSIQPGLKAHVQYVSKVVDSPAPSGIGAKSITANGTYYAISEGLEGYNVVDVNVSGGGGSTLIEKTVNANGVYNASSDSADGYSKVTVSVPASAVDTGTKSITANGTGIDVIGYAAVDVAVPNTYAAGDEGKVVSNGALVSQTAHAEVTQNGTIDTTLNNSVTVNVSGGGSDPTDGIIIKSRDSDGYATEVDFYNEDGEIPIQQFGNQRANSAAWTWGKVTKINLKGANSFVVRRLAFYYAASLTTLDWDKITEIPGAASTNNSPEGHFQYCKALTTVNAPNLTGGLSVYCFYGCTALITVTMPKISALHGYQTARGCFQNCTALTTCTFGSVGYPVTTISNNAFTNDTQSGLTITVYTTASYVDTALANVRNGATNATIVIKASEALTYGGTSYAAGDTVVISTP